MFFFLFQYWCIDNWSKNTTRCSSSLWLAVSFFLLQRKASTFWRFWFPAMRRVPSSGREVRPSSSCRKRLEPLSNCQNPKTSIPVRHQHCCCWWMNDEVGEVDVIFILGMKQEIVKKKFWFWWLDEWHLSEFTSEQNIWPAACCCAPTLTVRASFPHCGIDLWIYKGSVLCLCVWVSRFVLSEFVRP